MLIHNWFSDILRSVRILFDKVIFIDKAVGGYIKNPYIKKYTFNIANRTFDLSVDDYSPKFQYPTCNVNLIDDEYAFGERTGVIRHHACPNFNQIPVLHDFESGASILIQEEAVNVTISVQINCETLLQAKEVEFSIKRWLPRNKHIQVLEFTSFLEIHPKILLENGIDFNNHEVSNLFTIMNSNTGILDFCYSIMYRPIIRLDSIRSSSADSTSRSFTVDLDLTYLIQMPMWTCTEKYQRIDAINIDFIRFGNEPITSNSCKTITKKKFKDKKVKRNLIITEEFLKLDGSYLLKVSFDENDLLITDGMEYNIFDTNGNIHYRVMPKFIDKSANMVKFLFSQDEYFSKFKPDITNPIILQFIEKRS